MSTAPKLAILAALIAGLAMAFASVSVVNALRLRRFRFQDAGQLRHEAAPRVRELAVVS